MTHRSQFAVRNDLSETLTLNIEPEGVFFPLGKGEEVLVIDVFMKDPVTLKLTNSDGGVPIISIWPGDGEVRVVKEGTDVFDLIQKGAGLLSAGALGGKPVPRACTRSP